ncbi:MAG: sigma-70 family RNA polymerase sigma factor [Verrucomicrobiales bacterium]|nr:sigma-70 family RNA polymerase sigma factor [Verrucomicrobiales bacterium]
MNQSESFHTTHWTRVLAAKGDTEDSRLALSDLCDTYYDPVHAYIQYTVRDVPADMVRDLTHEFFAGLLTRPGLDSLERGRGKFRSYLLGAVKNFLSDWRIKQGAEKRGGNQEHTEVDEDTATSPANDATYDRQWAYAVLGRALSLLEQEHRDAGKLDHFENLKPWLNGNATELSQAEVAQKLGISEGAVKVAIHRLRKRFRTLIRSGIEETVLSEEEVGIELNYLIEVLR